MANCNDIFKHYNSVIKLNDANRKLLVQVRNELRERMKERFKDKTATDIPNHNLDFQSQGSFVMDTIITPKDDDFDLDDGVYFIGNLSKNERPKIEDFHQWVLYAIGENETYASIVDKDTCVRIAYKKEKFHIDLPIYYTYPESNPDLAHKITSWTLSGPVEFVVWFEEKAQSGFKQAFLLESKMFSEYERWLDDIRKADVQLRRIVRYLKAWGDHLRGDMPPGIILTILAAENYEPNERDDISLRDTLQKIKDKLDSNGCKCLRPTTPKGQDLFEKYEANKKKYFVDELNKFVNSANYAIASPNQKEACLKWQNHLGNRFPCSLAKDEIEGAKQYAKPAIIGDTAKSA